MGTLEDTKHLVARAKSGDRAAFDKLVSRHRFRLEAMIRTRLGQGIQNRVGVEDVFQETILRAFRAIDRFEFQDKGCFLRWLSGIAVKVILEEAHNQRQQSFLELSLKAPTSETTPSRALERDERFDRFEKAIQSLPPDYRKVLQWVRLEGFSVTEAARRMNRSPNAVSHLLLRALRKLRDTFGDTESFHLPDRRWERKEETGDG